ncbi:MAG: hypothetical protein CL537_02755 [Alcanivoracaceae bacterium]|nr:hypothetical protein [Alcanivoracaceae bacterium]MCG8439398.1 hypothetical protein [Pseudomonadales bacterium]MED5432299.1 hypothetical protein [Pseudomonadota bacterium]
MVTILVLVFDILLGGITLYAAAAVVRVDLEFRETVIAALVAAGLAVIPYVGWLLSLIGLFYVLYHFSLAALPSLILMVLVSRFLVVIITAGFLSALS